LTEVIADEVYQTPKKLKISSTPPRISFSYHGLSFSTKRVRYNYFLEGVDDDWQATWEKTVSYNNLKPGEYTFKVIAINRDLTSSETSATVAFKIVLPWYDG